jgi:uncharacterized membrane protein YGL010W
MFKAFIENWKTRHTTPFNLVLHAVGIPLTLLALIPLIEGNFLWALVLFVLGYVLQFIGHRQEKTEVGELMWIKKIFRK